MFNFIMRNSPVPQLHGAETSTRERENRTDKVRVSQEDVSNRISCNEGSFLQVIKDPNR
jgi:hypothetical protein